MANMTNNQLNALIDQTLLDMQNTEAPSVEEASALAYTDADYAKLLADIQSDDENLAEAEADVSQSEIEAASDDVNNLDTTIEDLMKQVHVEDLDLDPTDSADEQRIALNKRIRDSVIKSNVERAKERIEINRFAFSQDKIRLTDELTRWDKITLVEELTKKMRNLIARYNEYINRRIAQILMPAIPAGIKIANLRWPWVFISNPGFLYRTHPESGEILTYWATPKVPYYFKQGTEQQILETRDSEMNAYYLEAIDRAIHRLYETQRRLADKEVFYAAKLVPCKTGKHMDTYEDLLEFNPFWFKKLYDRIAKENPYGDAQYENW